MYIAALTLDVLLGDVHSLKGKRGVVRPLVAELRLLELGLEHALERGLDFLDRLVDDRVVADLDLSLIHI